MNSMKRTYSLFEKVEGKWMRLSPYSYKLGIARSFWQNALITGSSTGHHMELRPATGIGHLAGEAEECRKNWKNFLAALKAEEGWSK